MKKFFDKVLIDEKNNISVTYYLVKKGVFYGLEAIQKGGFDDGGSSSVFVQTGSFKELRKFARLVADGKVMPVSLVDVANDYLVRDLDEVQF